MGAGHIVTPDPMPLNSPSRAAGSDVWQGAPASTTRKALTAAEKDQSFADLLALAITAGAMYLIFSRTGAGNLGPKLVAAAVIGLGSRWFFRAFTQLTRILRYIAMALIILALLAFLRSVF